MALCEGSSGLAGCECGGLWLSHGAAHQLVDGTLSDDATEFLFAVDTQSMRMEQPESSPYRRKGVDGTRRCPECSETLKDHIHEGLTIDVCAHHGNFFDRHEAVHIFRRVEARKQAEKEREQREMEKFAQDLKTSPDSEEGFLVALAKSLKWLMTDPRMEDPAFRAGYRAGRRSRR